MATPVLPLERPSTLLRFSYSGPPDAEQAIVLFLDEGETHAAAKDFQVSFPDCLVVSVAGPRGRTTPTETLGRYWYIAEDMHRPEAASFGDALYQGEALLHDLVEAHPSRRLLLTGRGQAGVIAITLAVIWPELVTSVATIDAGLPKTFDALPLTTRPLAGLHALLLHASQAPLDMPPWVHTTRIFFEKWGGEVRTGGESSDSLRRPTAGLLVKRAWPHLNRRAGLAAPYPLAGARQSRPCAA